MDTGAAVRARNHAENDAGIVAAADIVRIGMRAVAPHAVKRQLRVRREDGQRAVDAVDVVCAGQDERRKLEQERHRRHRVLLREGTTLEHHGLELLHDRIGCGKSGNRGFHRTRPCGRNPRISRGAPRARARRAHGARLCRSPPPDTLPRECRAGCRAKQSSGPCRCQTWNAFLSHFIGS